MNAKPNSIGYEWVLVGKDSPYVVLKTEDDGLVLSGTIMKNNLPQILTEITPS